MTRASHSNLKFLKSYNFMFLHCCQDYLKMKKSWKKRVSGCNSVDLKTEKFSRTLGLSYSSLLKVKSFHLKKKNFMASFYRWGSTASRLQPLRGGSLLIFTIQFNFYLHPTCLLIHNESGLLWHNNLDGP